MTETTKKTEQSPKPVNTKKDEPKRKDEIADKDLDKVAGGPGPILVEGQTPRPARLQLNENAVVKNGDRQGRRSQFKQGGPDDGDDQKEEPSLPKPVNATKDGPKHKDEIAEKDLDKVAGGPGPIIVDG